MKQPDSCECVYHPDINCRTYLDCGSCSYLYPIRPMPIQSQEILEPNHIPCSEAGISQGRGYPRMIIYVSLLVALVGLLCYILAANPKVQELGRLSFACGLLAFLLRVTAGSVQIMR